MVAVELYDVFHASPQRLQRCSAFAQLDVYLVNVWLQLFYVLRRSARELVPALLERALRNWAFR